MKKHPLSELDQLQASSQLKKTTLQHVLQKKEKRISWKLPLGLLATACLCFLFLQLQEKPSPIVVEREVLTYISVDINPSLELLLDKEDKVIDIKFFNKEAEDLLIGYSYTDKDAQIVLQELVGLPTFQPYLDQGYLQVSVFSEDESISYAIEQRIDEALAQLLNQDQYGCTCASKQEKSDADMHHMSFGKYQLISTIINQKPSYNIQDLENYTMRELKDLYETIFDKEYQGGSHGKGKHHKHK